MLGESDTKMMEASRPSQNKHTLAPLRTWRTDRACNVSPEAKQPHNNLSPHKHLSQFSAQLLNPPEDQC